MLYHYTDLKGLRGILQKRHVWATDLRYLNDSAEFRLAMETCRRLVASIAPTIRNQTVRAAVEVTVGFLGDPWNYSGFLFSLSSRGDSLSQWRAYCPPYPQGGGYAIGFCSAEMQQLGNDTILARCLYTEDEQRELVEDLLSAYITFYDSYVDSFPLQRETAAANICNHLQSDLQHLAPMIKNESFEDEREWRIIVPSRGKAPDIRHRPRGDQEIPYVEVSWKNRGAAAVGEIVVGPMPDQKSAEADVLELLAAAGIDNCSVACSSSTYREL